MSSLLPDHNSRKLLGLLLLGLFVTACGGGDKDETAAPAADLPDNRQEVKDYYAARPEFFAFKTLADLPADLTWEDGMDLPELGSDDAIKGGLNTARFPTSRAPCGPSDQIPTARFAPGCWTTPP